MRGRREGLHGPMVVCVQSVQFGSLVYTCTQPDRVVRKRKAPSTIIDWLHLLLLLVKISFTLVLLISHLLISHLHFTYILCIFMYNQQRNAFRDLVINDPSNMLPS